MFHFFHFLSIINVSIWIFAIRIPYVHKLWPKTHLENANENGKYALLESEVRFTK